jgi:hypothetical protein
MLEATKDMRTPQERLVADLDNYFELSDLLTGDIGDLLKIGDEFPQWRRNLIRSSAALFEGYTWCLKDMCTVSFDCSEVPALTKCEMAVLKSEKGFATEDRIRLTLRAAYKLFRLTPAPDFGGQGWVNGQLMLKKRHSLMHPKTPEDLSVADESWIEVRKGTEWLMIQFVQFFALARDKYIVEYPDDRAAKPI